MARRRQTSRTSLKAALPKGHILSLPPNILRMILAHVADYTSWLASATTVCRAFREAIEPILYRDVSLGACMNFKQFYYALTKDAKRAIAVRKLDLGLLGVRGTSIKSSFKRVLKLLVNLTHLGITADDPTLFSLLRDDFPFRLQALQAGGEHYPSDFDEVLYHHPTIEYLCLKFKVDLLKQRPNKFKHASMLKKIRALAVETHSFPITLFQYPYPVQYLSLGFAEPQDVRHALKLFGNTLITLKVDRYLAGDFVTRPWCWPTAVLRKMRLPKLQHLRVIDHCDRKNDELPFIDVKDMQVPNMREVCPKLKTIVWGAASLLQDNLYFRPGRGRKEGEQTLLEIYARQIFASSPKLERMGVFIHTFGIYLDEEMGHLFVREKGGALKSSGMEWELIHIKKWLEGHDTRRFWELDYNAD